MKDENKKNEKETQENEDNEKKLETRLSNISDSGCVITNNKGATIHSLVIAGQIEGHVALSGQSKSTKYEHVIPQLVGVEESNDVDGLLVLINTVGGDVEAGLAIAELVSGMTKPTASLVLGGGHSIGVPLAVSTNRSFIVPSATMTIHPVRTNGLVIGVMQSFSYLMRMQERICDFIVRHSNIQSEHLKKLMLETDELASDMGSVVDGNQAVEIGLIDQVGSLSDALKYLHDRINEKN